MTMFLMLTLEMVNLSVSCRTIAQKIRMMWLISGYSMKICVFRTGSRLSNLFCKTQDNRISLLIHCFETPLLDRVLNVPGAPSRSSDVLSKPSYKHIPKKGMLAFDFAQFDGILKKMSEFNSTLLSDPDKKHLSLSEGDVPRLNGIVKILKDTSHYHSSKLSDTDVAMMLKLLKSWPVDVLFPVIDVVRMIVLHPNGAHKLVRYVKNENDS